jgi:hypothetical protein
MEKEFRYGLIHYRERKHSSLNRICPNCGKKEFVPFIDLLTGEAVDDTRCGVCERKINCGYSMSPSEWAEKYAPPREWLPWEQWIALQRQREKEAEQIRRQLAQREAERKANSFKPYAETQPPKVQAYLDRMAALCKQMHNPNNTLMDYLYAIGPSKEKVDAAFHRYRIGSFGKRKVIYWQIDRCEMVRTGKIMDYGTDGHRKKDEGANWVHCQDGTGLATKEQLAPQCLFGEHLIGELIANPPSDGKKPRVGVLESEKSAIILSLLCPDIIWLATGGMDNFKAEMLEVIKPFNVIVYPDADALDIWSKKVEQFNRDGYQFFIPDWYREKCTPEARARKMDIADMMLEGI